MNIFESSNILSFKLRVSTSVFIPSRSPVTAFLTLNDLKKDKKRIKVDSDKVVLVHTDSLQQLGSSPSVCQRHQPLPGCTQLVEPTLWSAAQEAGLQLWFQELSSLSLRQKADSRCHLFIPIPQAFNFQVDAASPASPTGQKDVKS